MWKIISESIPLGVANLSVVILTTTDLIMLAQTGTFELASGVLAMQLYAVMLVFGEGLVMGFGPNYGQRTTVGDSRALASLIHAGVATVALFGAFALLVMYFGTDILLVLQQEEALANHASLYMLLIGAAIIPNLLFLLFWEVLLYHDSSRLVLVGAVSQVLINAVGNYALIYGKFGFPELGLVGAGYATIISSLVGCGVLFFLCVHKGFIKGGDLIGSRLSDMLKQFKALVSLGAPFGLMLVSTLAFLSAASYLMGLYGQDAISAHAIAFQINEIFVIFLLGFGEYAALLFSTNQGGKTLKDLRRTCLQVCTASLIVVAVFVIPTFLMRKEIIDLVFSADAEPLGYAAQLAYQIITLFLPFVIINALIIVLQGILRGLHSTTVPFVLTLIGYWGIGFTSQLSLIKAFPDNPLVVWWGMQIGFAVTLVMLVGYLIFKMRDERLLPSLREAAQSAG